MAGSFINIDTGFPTFTGNESERERTAKMLNYLRQLVDELKYTLNNLEEKNFNRTALDRILEDGTEDLREQVETLAAQLQTLAAQLQQTNSNVASLSSRVGNLEGLPARMTAAEDSISGMQQDIQTNAGAIADNTQTIGLLSQAVTQLLNAISVDAAGNASIGGTGRRVDLIGDVYINGTPQ